MHVHYVKNQPNERAGKPDSFRKKDLEFLSVFEETIRNLTYLYFPLTRHPKIKKTVCARAESTDFNFIGFQTNIHLVTTKNVK